MRMVLPLIPRPEPAVPGPGAQTLESVPNVPAAVALAVELLVGCAVLLDPPLELPPEGDELLDRPQFVSDVATSATAMAVPIRSRDSATWQ
jgi:hypothetical protein